MHSTGPAVGTVYLIHFDIPYKHARHYIGWALDLDARLRAHLHGYGARLIEVINDAGIPWRLARTWPGGRDRERAIKNRHEAPRLCPVCSAHPKPVTEGRSALLAAARTTPDTNPALTVCTEDEAHALFRDLAPVSSAEQAALDACVTTLIAGWRAQMTHTTAGWREAST